MIRFLVLLAIAILVIVAFRMGRQSERGRLIDLEPDKAQSDKWAARDVSQANATQTSEGVEDGDVIDISPDNDEAVGK